MDLQLQMHCSRAMVINGCKHKKNFMDIHVFKSQEELLSSLAEYFIKIGNAAIAEKGAFDVSLVGGNSPKKLYALLTAEKFKTQIDWKKINFFFGDERYVPANDPQYNALMVENILFEPMHISESQIFRIDTSLSPYESAKNYNEVIAAHFKNKTVRFDLILLGLGDNAHTASLFPFTEVLTETSASVKSVFVKELNSYRITMTAPMINQAKHIAFLVFGEDKAEAVDQILNAARDIQIYPAQLIKPSNGKLDWFLDEAAAKKLKVKE